MCNWCIDGNRGSITSVVLTHWDLVMYLLQDALVVCMDGWQEKSLCVYRVLFEIWFLTFFATHVVVWLVSLLPQKRQNSVSPVFELCLCFVASVRCVCVRFLECIPKNDYNKRCRLILFDGCQLLDWSSFSSFQTLWDLKKINHKNLFMFLAFLGKTSNTIFSSPLSTSLKSDPFWQITQTPLCLLLIKVLSLISYLWHLVWFWLLLSLLLSHINFGHFAKLGPSAKTTL